MYIWVTEALDKNENTILRQFGVFWDQIEI